MNSIIVKLYLIDSKLRVRDMQNLSFKLHEEIKLRMPAGIISTSAETLQFVEDSDLKKLSYQALLMADKTVFIDRPI